MLILSFDIGIKNLAYCMLDTETKDILDWHIIDCRSNNEILSAVEELDSLPHLLDADIVLLEKQLSFNPKMRSMSRAIHI